MVTLPCAEPGYTNNIIMWTEEKAKNSRRKEMCTIKNSVIMKLRGGM
jgi:hypothetical protein